MLEPENRRSRPLRVAMIGTRGVPARYGGFETAIDEIGQRLVVPGLRHIDDWCWCDCYDWIVVDPPLIGGDVEGGTALLMITVSKPVIVGRSRARALVFPYRAVRAGPFCAGRW